MDFKTNYILIFPDSWGDVFPVDNPDWDLVIASDILLCKCLIPQ